MTIALSNSTPIQNPGNGTAVAFSFPWKISAVSDLIVGFIVGGVYTQQGSATYTVSGIGNNGGGQVTFFTAPPLGTTVDIRTVTPQTQPTDFANLGAYLPENTTNAVDRLTRQVQDLTRLVYTYGIHGPDQEFTPWPALPTAAARANSGMLFDQNGLPTVGVLTTTPLTQSLFNAFLSTGFGQVVYPPLPGESGLVPAPNTLYPALPIIDARRYGFGPTDPVSNANAIQNAITAAQVSGTQGATVLLPPGTYQVAPGIVTLPQGVIVRGSGKRSTYLQVTANGSEPLFLLGGNGIAVTYGTGVTDLGVQWTGTSGAVVYLQGTVGAEVARLYIEGETITAGRATSGVVIDGSNASAYFNKIDQVECNHFHIGFTVTTTGSTEATQQIFTDCNATGDVGTDTSSVGFFFNAASGQGTVMVGCDAEGTSIGYDIGGSVNASGVGPITFIGCRGESNSIGDMVLRPLVNACTLIGSEFESSTPLIDSSGVGNQKSRQIGNFFGVVAARDQLYLVQYNSNSTTDTPVIINGFPGQVSDLEQVKNNVGTVMAGTTAQGARYGVALVATGATPAGGAAGQLQLGSTTSLTASVGGNGSLPATVAGYLEVNISGAVYKIPYYQP